MNELFRKPLRILKALTPEAAKLCDRESIEPWMSIFHAPENTKFDPGDNP